MTATVNWQLQRAQSEITSRIDTRFFERSDSRWKQLHTVEATMSAVGCGEIMVSRAILASAGRRPLELAGRFCAEASIY